jgi:hypothetical protein
MRLRVAALFAPALLGAAALALALALSVPAATAATPPEAGGGSPAHCARLSRQIHHFEGMVERAEELGSAMWAERTQQHVDFLREQQKERCPDDAEDPSAKAAFLAFLNLLKIAGQAALSYFTFGAL